MSRVQTGAKRLTKAVKMVKSPKTGAYVFKEAIVAPDKVNDFFKKNWFYNIIFLTKPFRFQRFGIGTAFCLYICNF